MTVYWGEEFEMVARCHICKKSLDIGDSAGLDPIYCADCVESWQKVQRSWSFILIILAIIIYFVSVTIGPKLIDWNWPG